MEDFSIGKKGRGNPTGGGIGKKDQGGPLKDSTGEKNEKNPLESGRITMTHSGIFTRNKQKVVHVCFERKDPQEKAFAEAVLPSCTFLHNDGFAEEEIEALKVYLNMNQDEIFGNARQINKDVLFKL